MKKGKMSTYCNLAYFWCWYFTMVLVVEDKMFQKGQDHPDQVSQIVV